MTKVHDALLAAQCELAETVSMDRASQAPAMAGGYKYISAETILQTCMPILRKHGVLVYVENTRLSQVQDSLQHLTITFSVAVGDESMVFTREMPVVVGKGKPPDKASATAETYAISYFLRGLLMFPRVSPAEEVDSRPDSSSKDGW